LAAPEKLTPNQERALAALLTTGTIKGASEVCGLGVRTLQRYLASPDFRERYREERVRLFEQSVAAAQKLSSTAVAVFGRNLTAESTSVQIRAAKHLLDFMLSAMQYEAQMREIEQLRADIEELKQQREGL
jgi:hypothetical protein